jgi:hypothetical protein
MSLVVTCLEIAAFLSSLLAWPMIAKTKHLRWFPLLLFIVAFVETTQAFFRSYFPYFNNTFYNIQVPVQHLLYFLILWEAISSKMKKKLLVFSSMGFVLLTVITLVWFTDTNHFNVLGYCAGSTLIVVWILVVFYDMLQDPSNLTFLHMPFFYMLFACLLFNVGTLPYFLTVNWLHFIQKQQEITEIFISVIGILTCILYGTYTACFLWMRLRKVHY